MAYMIMADTVMTCGSRAHYSYGPYGYGLYSYDLRGPCAFGPGRPARNSTVAALTERRRVLEVRWQAGQTVLAGVIALARTGAQRVAPSRGRGRAETVAARVPGV